MTDLVTQAAAAIAPLLAGGAGLAAQELAKRSGSSVYDTVIGKLRRHLDDDVPDIVEVEAGLRRALDAGDLVQDDLVRVTQTQQGSSGIQNNVGEVKVDGGGSAFIGVHVSGDLTIGADPGT